MPPLRPAASAANLQLILTLGVSRTAEDSRRAKLTQEPFVNESGTNVKLFLGEDISSLVARPAFY
jgi:hypothetical protein